MTHASEEMPRYTYFQQQNWRRALNKSVIGLLNAGHALTLCDPMHHVQLLPAWRYAGELITERSFGSIVCEHTPFLLTGVAARLDASLQYCCTQLAVSTFLDANGLALIAKQALPNRQQLYQLESTACTLTVVVNSQLLLRRASG